MSYFSEKVKIELSNDQFSPISGYLEERPEIETDNLHSHVKCSLILEPSCGTHVTFMDECRRRVWYILSAEYHSP